MVEQRKNKRFEIQLPLRLVRMGIRPMSILGQTRNLSSGGVLFSTDARVDVGEPIEYMITLAGDNGNPVLLHCLGKVMRQNTAAAADDFGGFQVAATMERYEFVRSKS